MEYEENDAWSQKRNKRKLKMKENKKYPYKHCRHDGKILINKKDEK